MELIKKISFVLTIIGGLNWGLIGLLGIDFVSMLFGPMTILARLVYVPAKFTKLSKPEPKRPLSQKHRLRTVLFYFNTPFGSAWLPLTRSASAYN